MTVNAAEQVRAEEHFREVERTMLYVDEAARKATEAAASLKEDGAAEHLVAALETTARALRAEHKRLIQSVYWRAPEKESQGQLVSVDDDRERLAS